MRVLPKALASILIAEDDALLAEAITLSLEPMGYRVNRVGNGPDALRRIKHTPPDLLLLDLGLPLLDGFGVLTEMRRRRAIGQLSAKPFPVVVLTARKTIEDVSRALSLGACDYIAKPVDLSVLGSRIAGQLGHEVISR